MVNWTNISDAMTKLGSGLTQTAITSYTLRASSNLGRSIFRFGCGCGMSGMMNPMYNSMANPLGVGVFNPYNAYNAMNTQYGNALAFQWGQSLAQQAQMNSLSTMMMQQQQQQISNLKKTNNEYAGDIDKNQDTTKGAAFNKATSEMIDKNGEAVENKSFTISHVKNEKEYIKDVSNLSKSYLADIDKSVGNKDGEITIDEFVNYEIKNGLSSSADADEKSEATKLGQVAFSKLDQNGDNKVDWKEMAAGFATFDTDTSGESKKDLDGVITSDDFANWSTKMVDSNKNLFDTTVRKNYEQLFGKKDDEE